MKQKHLLAIFMVCGLLTTVQAKKSKTYFKQSQFDVDFDITHTIVAGKFLSRSSELLILGKRKNQQSGITEKIATIYSQNKLGKYYKTHEIILPHAVAVVDYYLDVRNYKKVLLLDSVGLWELDFKNNQPKMITKVDSLYIDPSPQFIAKKQLAMDFNGDGLDDLYIADFKKSTILIQQPSGEFLQTQLPIFPMIDMGQQIAFTPSKIFNLDINFDQLQDIVTLKNNQLVVFQQLKSGLFSKIPLNIMLPFKVSERPWWFLKGADGDTADQSHIRHTKLETIEDINGDGIADMMVKETQSTGVLDRNNRYDIYYGYNDDGLISFRQTEDTSITAEGTLEGLELVDINGDQRKEILVSSFDIGIGQIIGALISGSIDQDVFLFTLDNEGKYLKKPIFKKEVDLKFSLSSGKSGQAVILAADVNGDGMKEMLLSDSEKRLSIFQADAKTHKFRNSHKRHAIKLPQNGTMVTAANLQGNKSESLIVRYGKQDSKELRRRVYILTK